MPGPSASLHTDLFRAAQPSLNNTSSRKLNLVLVLEFRLRNIRTKSLLLLQADLYLSMIYCNLVS